MREKLWAALNSPIIVWFLGTVVVGLAVFMFEQHNNDRDRSQFLEERIEKCLILNLKSPSSIQPPKELKNVIFCRKL